MGGSVGKKRADFIGVNGVEVVGSQNVAGGVPREGISPVALGFIDWVVGPPFDDKTALLNEGLIVLESKGFNPSNRRIGHGKRGPLVARNPRPSGEGHEIIVALGVAGGVQRNGPE